MKVSMNGWSFALFHYESYLTTLFFKLHVYKQELWREIKARIFWILNLYKLQFRERAIARICLLYNLFTVNNYQVNDIKPMNSAASKNRGSNLQKRIQNLNTNTSNHKWVTEAGSIWNSNHHSLVRSKRSSTKSTNNRFPVFPIERYVTKPGSSFHIGDACSTATPRACTGQRFTPSHFPLLINQETEANHAVSVS